MIHETALIGNPPESRGVLQDPIETSRWERPDIHPTASVGGYVTIDAGMERATRVGARTLLMKKAHLGHDVIVGEDCEIAPGAVLCGYAILGDHVKVGVNASILPYVHVGDGAVIGAGAVVTKHVPAGETWVGNPAARIMPRAQRATLDGTPVRYRCGCWPDRVDPKCPHHGS